MRIFLFTLIAGLLLPSPGFAAVNKKFCAGAKTSADLVRCLSKTYETVQTDLKASYEVLMKEQSEPAQKALNQSQRDWIIYRNSTCFWEAGKQEKESLGRVHELSCLIRLSDARRDVLESAKLPIAEQRKKQGHTPRWMNVLTASYPDTYWKHEVGDGHDLNCDGRENFIISGLQVLKDPAELDPDYEPYKVVLGVATMPDTGKPDIRLFEFPVRRMAYTPEGENFDTAETEAETANVVPALCSPNPVISVINVPLSDDMTGKVQNCIPGIVHIGNPGCSQHRIGWQEETGFMMLPEEQRPPTE